MANFFFFLGFWLLKLNLSIFLSHMICSSLSLEIARVPSYSLSYTVQWPYPYPAWSPFCIHFNIRGSLHQSTVRSPNMSIPFQPCAPNAHLSDYLIIFTISALRYLPLKYFKFFFVTLHSGPCGTWMGDDRSHTTMIFCIFWHKIRFKEFREGEVWPICRVKSSIFISPCILYWLFWFPVFLVIIVYSVFSS